MTEQQIQEVETIDYERPVGFFWLGRVLLTADVAVFLVANAYLSSVEEVGNAEHRDRCWAVAERLGRLDPLFLAKVRRSLRAYMRPALAKIPYE